eukprot:359767-Chlamydomonas_euryale.AAC.1
MHQRSGKAPTNKLVTGSHEKNVLKAAMHMCRDGPTRLFRIYRIYGIYGRPLEAMYGTRTRMSALEGCLAAPRCGANAQRPSSRARRIHGPRRHSFVEHGRR